MPPASWPLRAGLTLLTTIALGGLAVTPAEAAGSGTASVSGSTVVQYKAAGGKQNKVVVTRSGRTVTIDDRVAVKAGKGCKKVKGDKTRVKCTTKKTPTRVRVYTYDRNDSIVNNTDVRMTADGGTAADRITGGSRGDRLYGGNGNDTVWGRGGNDTIDGQTGNDVVHAGDGDDTVEDAAGKSSGNDKLYGDNGSDRLVALVGNDKLYGGAGSDLLWGGPGRDRLEGGSGDDVLQGDECSQGSSVAKCVSADVLLGGPGTDLADYSESVKAITVDLDGASGDDGQSGEHDTVGSDVENLTGGLGNDRLTGNKAANQITGLTGTDTIRGGAGNDSLYGMDLWDVSLGAAKDGHDTLYGEAGDDQLYGLDDERNVSDRLDGGPNGPAGDQCQARKYDTRVNCEH